MKTKVEIKAVVVTARWPETSVYVKRRGRQALVAALKGIDTHTYHVTDATMHNGDGVEVRIEFKTWPEVETLKHAQNHVRVTVGDTLGFLRESKEAV